MHTEQWYSITACMFIVSIPDRIDKHSQILTDKIMQEYTNGLAGIDCFNCATILYGIITYYNIVIKKKCKPMWEIKGNNAYTIQL